MSTSDHTDAQHEEFVRLLNGAHRQVLSYLVSLLGNRSDAEDVFQRASIALWRKFSTFEKGTNFAAWASTVAFYEARNFQRMGTRSRLHFSEALMDILAAERVSDMAHTDARHDALGHCMDKLDDAARKLVEAAYLEGSDIGLLAEQFGRARQTLYNRLNTIRRLLADCVTRRFGRGGGPVNADFDRDELRTLFAALHDGTIAPEDHARLERILTGSEEARQLWFLHCDLETGMADWAATRRETRLLKIVSLPAPVAKPARTVWPWLTPLAAAAVVVLAASWWMRSHRAGPGMMDPALEEAKASGIAVLARAVRVEWADGAERTAGTVLEPGNLRLKSGAALVEFFSGARVVVEGPADIRLVSSGEAFLHWGKINAHVPPQARGFTVDSPDVKVVDHGTDFGFTVGRDAVPEVHVFTGKVEVASAKLAPRALQEGEAARFESGTFSPIPATRSSFLAEEELARRDTAFGLQRFAGWREASRALSADPAAVLHYTLLEADSPERKITNQSAGALPQSDGGIVGSAWTEGRWPGKRALQFRSASDRVRFTVPQPMPAVTLLAWVRVEALLRGQNVLLSAESEQPGALRWHLTKSGELRLEIARDLGRPKADWEAVNSAPFVTSARMGQWLLLATTFDGKTIRHYGNGQLIGSGAAFTPAALHIGTAELANWRGGTQRHLTAAMDEFAIFSRAMSAEEVRAIFQIGKP